MPTCGHIVSAVMCRRRFVEVSVWIWYISAAGQSFAIQHLHKLVRHSFERFVLKRRRDPIILSTWQITMNVSRWTLVVTTELQQSAIGPYHWYPFSLFKFSSFSFSLTLPLPLPTRAVVSEGSGAIVVRCEPSDKFGWFCNDVWVGIGTQRDRH